MGYEVESLNYYAKAYPEQPEAPWKDEYDTTEEYEQAQSEFEQDLNDYTEECEEIRTRSEAGEIILYFRIESKDIVLCYVPKVTCTTNDTKQEQTLSPVEKLEKQDKRNKEIALEKTVEDTKTDFGGWYVRLQVWARRGQDDLFLLAIIPPQRAFRSGRYRGKKPYSYLTDEEKINIIANLTSKQKAIIRRIF